MQERFFCEYYVCTYRVLVVCTYRPMAKDAVQLKARADVKPRAVVGSMGGIAFRQQQQQQQQRLWVVSATSRSHKQSRP